MSYREDLVFSSHKALARWLLSEPETGANKLTIHEACQNQYGESFGGGVHIRESHTGDVSPRHPEP